MIHLPRNLERLFRSLLRKFATGSFEPRQPLTLSAGREGLRLRAAFPDVLVEFFEAGDFGSDEASLRADLLKQCDGARIENLTLTAVSPESGRAEWRVDGIPQNVDWEPPAAASAFPQSSATLRPLPASFLNALQQAAACCSKDAVRYATNCILLDGTAQRIAATDVRDQILADFAILRVPVNAEQLDEVLKKAHDAGWSHLDFLHHLLADQAGLRRTRRIERLPANAIAFVNGEQICDDFRLQPNSTLEFVKQADRKGVGEKVWNGEEFCLLFKITLEDLQAWIAQGLKVKRCLDGSHEPSTVGSASCV